VDAIENVLSKIDNIKSQNARFRMNKLAAVLSFGYFQKTKITREFAMIPQAPTIQRYATENNLAA